MINNLNSNTLALLHQRRDDFRTLASAVEQGDMSSAKTALAALQKDTANGSDASGSNTDAGSGATKIKADFSALSAAVQGGNVSDAQSALQAMRADRGPPPGDGNGNGAPSDSIMNGLLKLVSDVGSGDQTSLQTDAQAFASQLQSAFGITSSSTSSDAQSAFVKDLTTLGKDASSGDQSALAADGQALAKDIQGLLAGAQASPTPGAAADPTAPEQGAAAPAHGHHHHHHAGGVESGATASQQSASGGTDGDADGQSNGLGGTASAAVRQYELTLSLFETSPGTDATQTGTSTGQSGTS